MPKRKVSFVIPVHNEAEILKKSLEELNIFLQKANIDGEIIIAENGSTDNTRKILKELDFINIKKIFVKEKSFGLALREGIKKASYDNIYFSGIDFPFGFENITNSLKYIDKYDIVFSSKTHPDSDVKRSIKRKVASIVYDFILKRLLGLKINDPQGTLMFDTKKIRELLPYCNSNDPFFTTQLALYVQLNRLKYIEIPVKYYPRSDSKMSVVKDGSRMFKQIMGERKKIKKIERKDLVGCK
ncbi:MAG: Glycosyl transferase family 2 [candidate division CPR2 bacterium GW2011_GWC1_41_48]|uniref:Glycosyl transferase family 2 n=1 Tax=candidate division CPR2 bacterium GW2011_GWC1_41_48 TaxID=1618344 RepID=A0A0G0Z6K7_UNCC2|nr:MAG: Glycosyl transferase family 2 [candidate division CPR2 bacterium GW2011_GWC2_39_35]KKR27719.1 MAG: Glycosyl transferase family 2 [candidate division CPR2 bacterium GW2011_GWD1_39_7]KKR28755.1 MAG: Glycosyl transferase family 2 [candidate division CPR2 bacterium GW2011_GWD2_39_7]KKS08658.1 MAG: Glycosyl transferase family 2 [candidate division CPR2 bacterium GW2011_GWC1_41_48]OGB59785.1 MAG: hypothetical protein A2Y27_00135 [candidate division CPR2 bacterium GWD1_39_7]OGB73144.1 MAG: hy